MKAIFLITLFLISIIGSTLCQGNCSNVAINSSIIQPTQASINSSTCNILVVKWQGSAGQAYCVSATYVNPTTNQKQTVSPTSIVCDGSQKCTATIPVVAGAQVNWSVQAISNGSASQSVISVLEYPIPACGSTGSSVTFCGKVLLQGAYNTAAKKMNTALNTSGILQAQATGQPYNSAPFNYAGTEGVGAGFFAAHADIVDWVLVELRDANAPSSIIGSRAAFVKQDGTLVETDGTNTHITLPGVANGTYHVAIRHRNHLGIRTTTPVDFTCGNVCVDFTSGSHRSFKNREYSSPVQIGTVWAMRAGNANVNQDTRYTGPDNDQEPIFNTKLSGLLSRILTNVYAPEDVNMDGKIKWNGPGNDQNFLLNRVLGGSRSAVFIEQF